MNPGGTWLGIYIGIHIHHNLFCITCFKTSKICENRSAYFFRPQGLVSTVSKKALGSLEAR